MADIDYMTQAIEAARKGMETDAGGPFGACLVSRNNEVIAVAHNEVLGSNDATRHAEMICISEACRKLGRWNLSDCTLYTTTEPCPMCFAAAHWAKIPRIVFGTRIEDAAHLGFNEIKLSNEALNSY